MCKPVVFLFLGTSLLYMPCVGSFSIYKHLQNNETILSFGLSTKFYGISQFENNLRYFTPLFIFDIIIYVPMVVSYGVQVILIPFLCNFIATYLEYIQLRLNAIYIESKQTSQSEARLIKLMKGIYQDHYDAMKFVKALNDIFNGVFLVKVAISSFLYCLLFFILTQVEDNYLLIKAVALVICLQLDVLLICIYGDRLITQSLNISVACYDVKWYNASIKFQKMIAMMIMMTNIPLKVTAWDFGDISIQSYGTIMRRTYSYFTLMRKVF
uniref:CSON008433 protein n=1 Tax=Culicoides sonorensis TaxID=179676 RepID=A0A336KP90_CULSO